MDTDEYEISLQRECNHCRQVVAKVRKALQQRLQQHGLTYEEVVKARLMGNIAIPDNELAGWQDDLEALPVWEQRLKEYQQALAIMRVSAGKGA